MSLNLRQICSLLGFLFIPLIWAFAQPGNSKTEASRNLPDKVGTYRARTGAAEPSPGSSTLFASDNSDVVSQASRIYASADGEGFSVEVFSSYSYSGAYALLATYGWGNQNIKRQVVGTAAILEPRRVSFFKGTAFVQVSQTAGGKENQESLLTFARTLANQIDGGDNDIPVLVKHLPAWESVQERTFYATNSNSLKRAVPNQPIIDELSFDGGTEGALAYYGPQKLLLVEFNTPQSATENDRRIAAKLQELRSQGQPAPTAYRRVGNYSVFVFDAPSQQAANQLIDQVKYEQMVQWLGENPYRYERAIREFTQTTLGVFVSVVKGSGLALVSCLAVGGLIGGLMFIRRRAQQREAEAYSDAGAMLRLNLDELTPKVDPARLLGRGK